MSDEEMLCVIERERFMKRMRFKKSHSLWSLLVVYDI